MSFEVLRKKPRGDGIITLNIRRQDNGGGFIAVIYFPADVLDRLGWDGGRYLMEAGKDEDLGALRITKVKGVDVRQARALQRNNGSGGHFSVPYMKLCLMADIGAYDLSVIAENDQSITLDMSEHLNGGRR